MNEAFLHPEPWQLLSRKFFKYKQTVIEIRKGKDGLWRDRWDCVYGLVEEESAVGDITDTRCGIGPLSLPDQHPANEICKIHDKKYTMPAYQLYNSRSLADRELEEHMNQAGMPILGWIFHKISRIFGGFFWEGKK